MDHRQIEKEELRLKLGATCPPTEQDWSAQMRGVPAAVLVGLVSHPEGLGIILTLRTELLENHAGQISLPGGRIEPGDGGPADAALREAFEEIGLGADKVEILGCLSPHDTVTGFHVYPFVGWIETPIEFVIDKREVASVFEVPLSFVLDPANHGRGSLVHGGERHHFYVILYQGHRIWGATAGILVSLAQLLGPADRRISGRATAAS